jgi:hypothetical protein
MEFLLQDGQPLLHRSAVSDADGAQRRDGVATTDDESWSTYGAERTQSTATGGKRTRRTSRLTTCHPLLLLASDCGRCCMVRRGSTVRVRQRALSRLRSRCKRRCLVAATDTAEHLLSTEGVERHSERQWAAQTVVSSGLITGRQAAATSGDRFWDEIGPASCLSRQRCSRSADEVGVAYPNAALSVAERSSALHIGIPRPSRQ